MIKLEEILKYLNDEELETIYQKKLSEKNGPEDDKKIKEILGAEITKQDDIFDILEKLPKEQEDIKYQLKKVIENYIEDQNVIDSYYTEKYFKIGVLTSFKIFLEHIEREQENKEHIERRVDELGRVNISLDFRNKLNWEYQQPLDMILNKEKERIELKAKKE